MKKKSTPLGDMVRSIKVNAILVISLAVILVIAAYIYIPAVKQELGAKPSEAFGVINPKYEPGTEIPINWYVGPETPLVVLGENSIPHDMYGNKIVYTNYWGDNYGIYLYDIVTKQSTKITDHFSYNNPDLACGFPRMWGDKVVYCDEVEHDIYTYDISTKTKTKLTTDGISGWEDSPDIYQNWVVFAKGSSKFSQLNIYLFNIETLEGYLISPSDFLQYAPRIDNNVVVWQDDRNFTDTGVDIYMYDITTHQEKPVVINYDNQEKPYILGNKIVWEDSRYNFYFNNIYMYDIATDEETQLTFNNQDVSRYKPTLAGNYVFYTYSPDGSNSTDIYMVDLRVLQERPVCSTEDKSEWYPVSWQGSPLFTYLVYSAFDWPPIDPWNFHGDMFMRKINILQKGAPIW